MTSRREGVNVVAAVAVAEWTHDDFRFVAFGVLYAVLRSFGKNADAQLCIPRDELQESTVCHLC